jgi:hypothetical protein
MYGSLVGRITEGFERFARACRDMLQTGAADVTLCSPKSRGGVA